MDPDRAAVVAGACVVLHNMAMMWRVPYEQPEEPAEGEDQPIEANQRDVQGATVRQYITNTYF